MWATLWNHGLPQIQWGVVIGASLAAAMWDADRRRIPNFLTGPVFLAGLAAAALTCGPLGTLDASIGCLIMAAPYLVLFVAAGGGAGDVKLMGAIGTWLGIVNGLIALFCVVVSGLMLALGAAAYTKWRRAQLATAADGARGPRQPAGQNSGPNNSAAPVQPIRKMTIPYGVAIFAGVYIAGLGVLWWRL